MKLVEINVGETGQKMAWLMGINEEAGAGVCGCKNWREFFTNVLLVCFEEQTRTKEPFAITC